MASSVLNPVMASAARLKELSRLSASMVKTPSLMFSRILQHGDRTRDVMPQNVLADASLLFCDMRHPVFPFGYAEPKPEKRRFAKLHDIRKAVVFNSMIPCFAVS